MRRTESYIHISSSLSLSNRRVWFQLVLSNPFPLVSSRLSTLDLFYFSVITFCVSSTCWWNLSEWYEECWTVASSPLLSSPLLTRPPLTLLSYISVYFGLIIILCCWDVFVFFGSCSDSICRPVCCFIASIYILMLHKLSDEFMKFQQKIWVSACFH